MRIHINNLSRAAPVVANLLYGIPPSYSIKKNL